MTFRLPVAIRCCDIFCNVIDNYGDIGVSWRLARQLAGEHRLQVRLWVDDLASLAKLCHAVDPLLQRQHCKGVEVRQWREPFVVERPAELVIETFACKLPQSYIEAMAEMEGKPVWINLEYLSAEDWVESHHKLPSPHPRLPLTKHFFFPGFTDKTGGLLLERGLLERRKVFQQSPEEQQAFWQSMGVAIPAQEMLKISLFGYENPALTSLLDAWVASAQPILCLVPEGRMLPQLGDYFSDAAPVAGKGYSRGNLRIEVLPFVEQPRYDELLWACDVNCVRGEDSFVRAQWAGRPLLWQIYPQHDAVHLHKLQAFLIRYCERLSPKAGEAMTGLWQSWNSGEDAGRWWAAFIAARDELDSHARTWAGKMAGNNLALNLLDFCQEIGRMRALKIESYEGQQK